MCRCRLLPDVPSAHVQRVTDLQREDRLAGTHNVRLVLPFREIRRCSMSLEETTPADIRWPWKPKIDCSATRLDLAADCPLVNSRFRRIGLICVREDFFFCAYFILLRESGVCLKDITTQSSWIAEISSVNSIRSILKRSILNFFWPDQSASIEDK